jgi:hypothetical protein
MKPRQRKRLSALREVAEVTEALAASRDQASGIFAEVRDNLLKAADKFELFRKQMRDRIVIGLGSIDPARRGRGVG